MSYYVDVELSYYYISRFHSTTDLCSILFSISRKYLMRWDGVWVAVAYYSYVHIGTYLVLTEFWILTTKEWAKQDGAINHLLFSTYLSQVPSPHALSVHFPFPLNTVVNVKGRRGWHSTTSIIWLTLSAPAAAGGELRNISTALISIIIGSITLGRHREGSINHQEVHINNNSLTLTEDDDDT